MESDTSRDHLHAVGLILELRQDIHGRVEGVEPVEPGVVGMLTTTSGKKISIELLLALALGHLDGQVFVVGNMEPLAGDPPGAWQLQGVFSEQALAVEAAGNRPGWFVGPVRMNEVLPENTVEWPGLFYPAAGPDASRG